MPKKRERERKRERGTFLLACGVADLDALGILGVGAKICLRRRSWSRGSRGHHRNLQKKSKSEVGLLQQDPLTLKSVLCLNKNGVLKRKF